MAVVGVGVGGGGGVVERRVHQMDALGLQFTKQEFLQWANTLFPGDPQGAVQMVERMWRESVIIPPFTPYYGDWAGVFSQGCTSSDHICRDLYRSEWREDVVGSLMRRSYSEGQITEMNRATTRHPGGHPTARGAGWLAAR